MRDNGATVPFITSDNLENESLSRGTCPGALATVNFGSGAAEKLEVLRPYAKGGPLMVTEFWVGWVDAWGDNVHHRTAPEGVVGDLEQILDRGSVNFYMFHGGTSFGWMNGANDYGRLTPDVTSYDYDAHHALAAKAAEQGAVLLKNEGNILPLKEGQTVALIGHMAKELRFQGAGSSHINPTKITNPVDAMPSLPYAPGCDGRGDTTDDLIAEAVELAKRVEIPVVFAGLPGRYESEGFDRADMKMPAGHLRLIDAVANANPNTVVVLLCGASVECPWADKVRAILYMGLPGQAGGEAIAGLLYGRANPSGKLAESWPVRYEDCISAPYYGKTKDALYLEGIYVGYRYYDKAGKAVRWPFGYGLSYTSFCYSDLRVEGRTVSVTVANTGDMAGAEVVQLYVRPPRNGVHRPVRELKGFQKVFLQPGEAKTVDFELDDRAFALWQGGWKIPAGTYGVEIGGLIAQIQVDGVTLPIPDWQKGSWYESCAGAPTKAGWEAMLGRKYTLTIPEKGRFTMDNTVEEMKDHSLIMKIMYKAVEGTIAKGFGGKKDYENPEFRMLMASSAGSPLRAMQISGGMKGGVLPGMLEMANGHYLRGIKRMITG